MLFAGTTRGVSAVSLQEGIVRSLGLDACYINHVAKLKNTLVVACPHFTPLHTLGDSINSSTHPNHAPGLHVITLPGDISQPISPPKHVWDGDARSCRLFQGPKSTSSPYIFIGSEPADVYVSNDDGQHWHNTNSFTTISTQPNWTFPVKPHTPHVLSQDPAELSDGTPVIIAGIEVGGVLSTADFGTTWKQHLGVYEDVHSVRSDPFNRRRWMAVTGAGIWLTQDGGDSWTGSQPVAGRKLYVVGQSWNPYRQGQVLVAAGDGPPSRGAAILLSQDGGLTFEDITDRVKEGVKDGGEEAFRSTPVPLWTDGGAVLGLSNGMIVCSEDDGLRVWRVVARLGARVQALASCDDTVSPSSVAH